MSKAQYPDDGGLKPQVRPLGETFSAFQVLCDHFTSKSEPGSEPELDLSWILLAVNRFGEPLVLDASPGFYEVDLITELFACDNGIQFEKNLKPGLYKVTDCRVVSDSYGDPDISGKWERLA